MAKEAFYERAQKNSLRQFSPGMRWGDLHSGKVVQKYMRGEVSHINLKELRAAISCVQSLCKPKEIVLLSVDNLLTYRYLFKVGDLLISTFY